MARVVKGASVKDKITVKNNKVVVKALEGNDTITVAKSSKSRIYGGDGNDSIILKNGNNNIIYGDNKKDKVSTTGFWIFNPERNDKIDIRNGNKNRVYGGAGDDTIRVRYGKSNKVYGGDGNDTIYIKAGHASNRYYGGEGDDKFYGNKNADYLSGGNGNDLLKGANGNDILTGGKGDDKLYGGKGQDIFWYSAGNDTIFDYEAGTDTIRIKGAAVKSVETAGKDAVLNFKNGGALTVKNMAGKELTYVDAKKQRQSVVSVSTPLSVMRSFMKSLSEYSFTEPTVTKAMNAAVNYASAGRFKSLKSLFNSFFNTIKKHGSQTQGDYSSPEMDPNTVEFLAKYMGINLTNGDTGAITGKDAGGKKIKTRDGVIPEAGTLEDIKEINRKTSRIGGAVFHWAKPANKKEKMLQNCIYTWWAKEGLKLIKESYGLDFNRKETMVKDIYVHFSGKKNQGLSAYVTTSYDKTGKTTALNMTINTEGLLFNNVNGSSKRTEVYTDATVTHELTHAVMAANIKNFSKLPSFIKEGAAELTIGVDKEYGTEIGWAADATDESESMRANMQKKGALEAYYGGYMLLRYFAKQSSEYINRISAPVAASPSADSTVIAINDSLLSFDEKGLTPDAPVSGPAENYSVSSLILSTFDYTTSPVTVTQERMFSL